LAVFLTVLGRLGRPGRALGDILVRAPGLDLAVAALTWLPWAAGGWMAGWPGVGAVLIGQWAAFWAWVWWHELVNPAAMRGPRIVRFHNRIIGRVRNQIGLWLSVLALATLWIVRISEILLYLPLRLMVGFPPIRHGDFVNVSRQKFSGLVGHDLIWCLYCDWMTGVFGLAGEMLRNVETFWCPILFSDPAKCENCRVDFPDIDGGWVRADGTMEEVVAKMEQMHGAGNHTWFGHPGRRGIELPLLNPAKPPQPDR
jgi:hypothetical protein